MVFDGPPGHECGRFVEVEDQHGHNIAPGEWIEPAAGDKFWRLRIAADRLDRKRTEELEWAVRYALEEWAPSGSNKAERMRKLLIDAPAPQAPEWIEVTRQLGERVARLEAVGQLLDVKTPPIESPGPYVAPTPPPAQHVHVYLEGKCECGDTIQAAARRTEPAPSKLHETFAGIAKSPEFQQVMTEGVMRDFVRTDRYLKQLLGPEEYEVMQRRLVMGGPRITAEPSGKSKDLTAALGYAPDSIDWQRGLDLVRETIVQRNAARAGLAAVSHQREADMKEATRTVEDLSAKLAETERQLATERDYLAKAGVSMREMQGEIARLQSELESRSNAVLPHSDIARRIRESAYIKEFASWQGDGDWLADATDDQLLDRLLERVKEAERLEEQVGAVLGLCWEANMLPETREPVASVRAALERARNAGRHEADIERAALVAKLQLVREALGQE